MRSGRSIRRKEKQILGYGQRGLNSGIRSGRTFVNGLLRSLETRSNCGDIRGVSCCI